MKAVYITASCLFVIAVLLNSSPEKSRADQIDISTKINNKTDKAIKDATITFEKPAGIKVTGVPDLDSFNSVTRKDNTVKLDDGNIPAGKADTPRIRLDVPKGTTDVTVKISEISYRNLVEVRGTGPTTDTFSRAVFGGATGTTFAGVSIPALQYGYFYEFYRSAALGQSPTLFTVGMGGATPVQFGVLSNTWSPSLLTGDLPGFTGPINSTFPLDVQDHMVPDQLTGTPGIMPSSLSFVSGSLEASYTSPFAPGDAASVLWFISPNAPEVGGPDGLGGQNASFFSGGTLLATDSILSPVPAPSSVGLLVVGITVLATTLVGRRLQLARSSFEG
jgi:hypothetical protein